MKPVIIIAVAVVCSVVAVIGVLILIGLAVVGEQQSTIYEMCDWNYSNRHDVPEYNQVDLAFDNCIEGNFTPIMVENWKKATGRP